MTELSYTNGPAGYTSTTSGGTAIPSAYGAPSGGDFMDFFREMAGRNLAAQKQARKEAAVRGSRGTMQQHGYEVDQVAPMETPWYTYQGAATKPIGGPGIVPGMMIDQTKLPPWMRPGAAGMVGSRSRVPTGSVDSPDLDAEAASVQNTNLAPAGAQPAVDPYEAIRRRNLNSMYAR